MTSSKERLEQNDWCIVDEGNKDVYFGKYIDDEYIICSFRKSTNDIFCVDVSERYLSPDFVRELNKEIEKLEIKN